MSNLRFTGLLALCAVLAACDRPSPSRNITAPNGGRALLGEAATDTGMAFDPEGPFDQVFEQVFATEDPSAQLTATGALAATGGRATGHVGFAFSPPALGIVFDEKYSFTALSTEPPPPLAAKGELHVELQSVTAHTKQHSDVICMTIVGNRARIAARNEKRWRDNVQIPPGVMVPHNVWTVEDNGEGQGTPDRASLMVFTSPTVAQFHCATGLVLPLFPIQEGNVQVSPN